MAAGVLTMAVLLGLLVRHYFTVLPSPTKPEEFPKGSAEYNEAVVNQQLYAFSQEIYEHRGQAVDNMEVFKPMHRDQVRILHEYVTHEVDNSFLWRYEMWSDVNHRIVFYYNNHLSSFSTKSLEDSKFRREVPPLKLEGKVEREDTLDWNYTAHHPAGKIGDELLGKTCIWLSDNKENKRSLNYYFSKLTDDQIAQLYGFAVSQERKFQNYNDYFRTSKDDTAILKASVYTEIIEYFKWCEVVNIIKQYGRSRPAEQAPKERDLKDGLINRWGDKIQTETKQLLDLF